MTASITRAALPNSNSQNKGESLSGLGSFGGAFMSRAVPCGLDRYRREPDEEHRPIPPAHLHLGPAAERVSTRRRLGNPRRNAAEAIPYSAKCKRSGLSLLRRWPRIGRFPRA